MPLMDGAWELFDKAVTFDEKVHDPSTPENLKRIATKGRDRKLDEACAKEAEALAAGGRHA